MAAKGKKMAVRGSIALISGLLIASACVRILTSAEAAFAQAGSSGALFSQMAQDTPAPQAEPRPDRLAMNSLLEALQRREATVTERETDLNIRAKALDVAQVEIERRIGALEAAEKRLEATLSVAQTASEDDLAKLTSVYENMKPKDAAALFEAMEPDFAAGFIARMRPDTAAKVMSGLNPQVAYSISVILAGRNANAPKS
jgi:flagellar motility protein MotE (MotC chaperone)